VGPGANPADSAFHTPITDASFWRAAPITNLPTPAAAGKQETVRLPSAAVRLLGQRHILYVAVRSVSVAGNVSALSNVLRIR
jgi:hypothetical protein